VLPGNYPGTAQRAKSGEIPALSRNCDAIWLVRSPRSAVVVLRFGGEGCTQGESQQILH